LTVSLIRHPVCGQAAQFFIDQWQQLIGGSGIALLSRLKNARDVAHASQSSAGTIGDNLKWC
jgi:hypothetical protein